jgi:hypothetical protein
MIHPPRRTLRERASEAGKVGLALLLWMLGVPGIFVLAYLIFG